MTTNPSGPPCGNNPNYQLADGDRAAVEGFHAYLKDRARLRDRIAEALEEADYRPDMRRGDLADAIMPVLPAPADRSAVLREAAAKAWAHGQTLASTDDELGIAGEIQAELLRMADKEQRP